jgi:hypothetical protein
MFIKLNELKIEVVWVLFAGPMGANRQILCHRLCQRVQKEVVHVPQIVQ